MCKVQRGQPVQVVQLADRGALAPPVHQVNKELRVPLAPMDTSAALALQVARVPRATRALQATRVRQALLDQEATSEFKVGGVHREQLGQLGVWEILVFQGQLDSKEQQVCWQWAVPYFVF